MIKTGISLITSFIDKTLGSFDNLLIALIIFITIDYITGVIKAIINKQYSSEIGFKGISKKVLMIFMVALATQIDLLLDNIGIRYLVIIFYIVNEGMSIIENASLLGLPIPEKLKQAFEKLNSK